MVYTLHVRAVATSSAVCEDPRRLDRVLHCGRFCRHSCMIIPRAAALAARAPNNEYAWHEELILGNTPAAQAHMPLFTFWG